MGLESKYFTEPYDLYERAKAERAKKVLVLEAHVDDADFGCGSTVYKHVRNGDDVQWHTFITKGYRVPKEWHEDSLITEYQKAKKRLAIDNYILYDYKVDTLDRATELRNLIYEIWHKFDPDVAYIPLRQSRHQDHRAIGDFAWQVSWRSHTDILAYPILNDYENFNPTVYSSIDEEALDAKMAALNMYHSQFALRSWFSIELVYSFMRQYGAFLNERDGYAEPFEQIKRVI